MVSTKGEGGGGVCSLDWVRAESSVQPSGRGAVSRVREIKTLEGIFKGSQSKPDFSRRGINEFGFF